MRCLPELDAAGMRTIIEDPVRAVVARHRLEKIVGPAGTYRLIGLLAVVASPREIGIQQSRSYLISFDGLHRGRANKHFPAPMVGGPNNRFGCNLGLKNWGHRLRMARQFRLAPTELRGVECGHLDHGEVDVGTIVN